MLIQTLMRASTTASCILKSRGDSRLKPKQQRCHVFARHITMNLPLGNHCALGTSPQIWLGMHLRR